MLKSSLFTLLTVAVLSQAQVPVAPIATYPADLSKYISIYTSIKWKPVATATGYHLQVATEATFASIYYEDSALIDTVAALKRLADTATYYWRVSARNASGAGAYSKVRSFTTNPPLETGPSLVGPADYSSDIALITDLSWDAFPSAKAYHIQVSKESNFTFPIVNDSAITGTVKKIGPLEKSMTYYWHVRAINGTVKSAWSKARFMTIGDAAALNFESVERKISFRIFPGASLQTGVLEFNLEKPSQVKISVVSLSGGHQQPMVHGIFVPGAHQVALNDLAPGIYFVRMQTGFSDQVRRIVFP
jgi:hypothetical protein